MNTLETELSAFDFHLPDERIALRPVEPRDACKLLAVTPSGLSDHVFRNISELLRPGDLLIGNDTKVIPAFLNGVRPARDANGRDVDVQVNLLERLNGADWICLCKPGRRLHIGDEIKLSDAFSAHVKEKLDEGRVVLSFSETGEGFWRELNRLGHMPIPPYIAKQRPSDQADHEDYQTVYARSEGSVAAPTAGLHFTPDLMSKLAELGIQFGALTLHVGAGTFAALTDENLNTNKLHSEIYEVPHEVLQKIRNTKAKGGRVIPVGTTALRTLEAIAGDIESTTALTGETDIFIRPGYKLRLADGLITNFHLPQSSLFMLVCAIMGIDQMQNAYAHAISNDYRFYSYGDACLLMP